MPDRRWGGALAGWIGRSVGGMDWADALGRSVGGMDWADALGTDSLGLSGCGIGGALCTDVVGRSGRC